MKTGNSNAKMNQQKNVEINLGGENVQLHKNPIGIYEKALPIRFTWEEKFKEAEKSWFVI